VVEQVKQISRIFLLAYGLLLAATAQAALTLSVDRNPVGMNESFTLTLSSDESLDGDPDFSWIDHEFEVVSRQQSSNFQMINGDVSRSLTWTMSVLPKQAGTIAIPPVKVGDRESNPLTLQVNVRAPGDTAAPGATGGDALLLQVEAEEGELYVQQQMLYTIRLFVAHNAGMSVGNGSSLSEPELASGDAVIKRLGEDSNYQTVRNGESYSVIERRYAIYPQQSGPLKIKPVLFTGQMVEATNRPRSIFDSMQQRTQIKRVASSEVDREVKAIPPEFQGSSWLPARSVQLVEQWPAQQQEMVVGEPVTRTVALMVDGLTSAQLPALSQDYPAELKSYPDQPQLQETPSAQGFSAVRQEKIALLASTPGQLILPPLELAWWNTVTGKQEIARLPARPITVVAAAGSSAPVPASAVAPVAALIAPSQKTAAAKVEQSEVAIAKADEKTWQQDERWVFVALLFAVAWLITLLLWWRSSRATAATPVARMQAAETLRALQKKLKQACNDDQAQLAKDTLLQWGQSRWPERSPASLGELAVLLEGELGAAIQELSRSLYSEAAGEWRGDRLWQAFNRKSQAGSGSEPAESDLVPLFRHQQL
jgi:hypothetical protein